MSLGSMSLGGMSLGGMSLGSMGLGDAKRDGTDGAAVFDQQRELLFAVAYRMLGRAMDAEDVVQDAWLRWSAVDQAQIADPRAYLIRVTSRLAMDRLRSVQARRESYVGPWLPEPILTSPDIAEDVALADSVSLAMLVVLETLSPLERAVFVLREAFAFSYAEIGDLLGRSEQAVRQAARRARDHVRQRRPRFDADPAVHRQATERFLTACATGDLDVLLRELAPDVTLVGDGGGIAKAPLRIVAGANKVARFLLGIATTPVPDLGVYLAEVNGRTAIVATSGGEPFTVISLDVTGGLISTVRLVANPEKLRALRNVDRVGTPVDLAGR